MVAQNNAFAFIDSLTGQELAHVIDTANPPGVLSPNNSYWNNFITSQSGNPIVAISIPLAVYNSNTSEQLSSFIANAKLLGNVISLTVVNV